MAHMGNRYHICNSMRKQIKISNNIKYQVHILNEKVCKSIQAIVTYFEIVK